MIYNVGDRLIWKEHDYCLRGYISQIKPINGELTKYHHFDSIIIKWENGKMTQYNDYMIEEAPQLSIDTEYYRNQKLEQLGI